jgi:hypothetical protein
MMCGVVVDYSEVRDVELTETMSIAVGSVDDEILQQRGWKSLREL